MYHSFYSHFAQIILHHANINKVHTTHFALSLCFTLSLLPYYDVKTNHSPFKSKVLMKCIWSSVSILHSRIIPSHCMHNSIAGFAVIAVTMLSSSFLIFIAQFILYSYSVIIEQKCKFRFKRVFFLVLFVKENIYWYLFRFLINFSVLFFIGISPFNLKSFRINFYLSSKTRSLTETQICEQIWLKHKRWNKNWKQNNNNNDFYHAYTCT